MMLVVVLFVTVFSVCNYIEHTYTREATVWVNEDGTTSFIDDCGYEWLAVVDNVAHGQRVILVMDDHCSSTYIKDDIVKKVKPISINID